MLLLLQPPQTILTVLLLARLTLVMKLSGTVLLGDGATAPKIGRVALSFPLQAPKAATCANQRTSERSEFGQKAPNVLLPMDPMLRATGVKI